MCVQTYFLIHKCTSALVYQKRKVNKIDVKSSEYKSTKDSDKVKLPRIFSNLIIENSTEELLSFYLLIKFEKEVT